MSEPEGRRLCDLRVVDLKLELERRGLDKTGVKQVLIERLQKALTDEGKDPDILYANSEEKSKKSNITDKNDFEKPDFEVSQEDKKATVTKSSSETPSPKLKNGNSQTYEDQETPPITLTLEEEEKIQDLEGTPDSFKHLSQASTDEKKSTNEESEGKEENADKSSTDADASKKEAAESSSSDGKKVPSNANPRAIWISNVAMNTRACDIKQALSQYGKVVGAKVVVNAKYPGTCCFGYVTMGSVEDANKVIENLNNTELNGQIIKIEKFDIVRSEQLKQMKNGRKSPERTKSSSARKEKSPAPRTKSPKEEEPVFKKQGESKEKPVSTEESEKTEAESSTSDKKSEKDVKVKEKTASSKDKSKEEDKRRSYFQISQERKSRDRKRTLSSDRPSVRSRSSDRKNDVLTFAKIREARERQRLREKERLQREEQRRRHEENLRRKEIERRHRKEAERLECEREKLRIEREKIEREKNELIRLERERQKLERERIELEKMELQRTRIRLEEDRRAAKRPAPYRRDDSFDDRKRSNDGRHFNEPPPPPHFDSSSKLRASPVKKFPNKDYKSIYDKRDEQKRGRDYDSERNRSSATSISRPSATLKFDTRSPYDSIRDRELHDRNRDEPPSVSSRITKDHRFDRDRDRSPHYRPGERRVVPDGKPTSSPRIPTGPLIVPRFESRNPSPWGTSTPKAFTNTSSKWPSKEDSWRQNPPSERWNTSGSRQSFSSNSNMNMTPSCPPPPGINNYPDRFDYNKVPSSIRKY